MKSAGIILLILSLLTFPAIAFGQACVEQWSTGTAPSDSLIRGQAAYWDGKVYITNGRHSVLSKLNFLSDLWIYDVATDAWSTGAAYDTTGWMNACMVVHEAKLYLFGGWDGSNPIDNTKIYDIATDTWSDGAALPNAASGAQCGVINGKAYVVGGDGQTAHSAYDIAGDSWSTTEADLASAFAFGLGTTDGTLFYIYGNHVSTTSFAFDPGTNNWAPLGALDINRDGPAGGYANGILYAFSGGGGGMAENSSIAYNLPSGPWASYTPSITTPVSSPASTYVPDFGGLFVVVNGGDFPTEDTLTQILTLCLAMLDDISPGTGDNDADVAVTISGWGFEDSDTAYLTNDKAQISLTGLTVVDENTITASVPAGSVVGTYNLVIESMTGESDILADAYEVTVPGTDDDDDATDDDDSTDDDDDDAVDDDDSEDDDDAVAGDDDDNDDGGCCG